MTGKKIILLSDGTGNSAAALFKTNVFRLYQALDLSSPTQVAFYDDGVGTSSFKPLAVLGGAFGFGLKRNVLDLYIELSRTFQPGDEIYLFGFSRGAFTARILAGLVIYEGLVAKGPEAEMSLDAHEAFRRYRERFTSNWMIFNLILRLFRWLRDVALSLLDLTLRRDKRRDRVHAGKIDIRFMGLWDTVAAYGLPIDELTRAWNAFFPLSVPDRNLNSHVERACHALALDDERNTFHPVLWNESGRRNQKNPDAQIPTHIDQERITQVWFAGMHSNVGGGYPLDGLAYITLDWMMTQISEKGPLKSAGLKFKRGEHAKVKLLADHDAPMADSRQGLGGSYRYQPRKLALLADDRFSPKSVVKIDRLKIHESVMHRIASGATAYGPVVLPRTYAIVGSDGSITDLPTPGRKPIPLPVFMEDTAQAGERATMQEWAWNLVWWRRVAYFTTIFILLFIAAMPLITPTAETCEGRVCFVSPLIDSVGWFLPSFLHPWLATWHSHPATFGLPMLVFCALLFWGGSLQTKIGDTMRSLWSGISPKPPRRQPGEVTGNWLYKLRNAKIYQMVVVRLKKNILPTTAGVIAAFLLVGALSRIAVTVTASLGGYCDKAPDSIQVTDTAVTRTDFAAKSICWSSNIKLEKGRRYAITVSLPGEWRDDGIQADVLGFGMEKLHWYLRPFVLFRRDISQFWFMPIARIGRQGSDEYPLYPNDWSRPQPGKQRLQMTAEITAKRDGPLYLFVNDVILPLNVWQPLYDNNHGTAEVTVTPLPIPVKGP